MVKRGYMRCHSLKATLLWWLVFALIIVMGGTLWLSFQLLRKQVDSAYDRSLAGALRAINLNVSTASGGLAMEQPYLLLEFFELTTQGRVYYRVATEDGLAEIGYPQLPMPDEPLMADKPSFYHAKYQGVPVRVAALARQPDPPLASDPHGRVIVQVAESLDTREAFIRAMLMRLAERDLLSIVISLILMMLAIMMSLRPLARLRDEMETRAPDDLSPIDDSELPSEVAPLVQAVNRHMQRYEAQARAQSQFLDDASHQLRTPLSVLRTQVAYALRESDPDELRAALSAMHEGLERAIRMTNQMLALARARDMALTQAHLTSGRVDLAETAENVLRTLLPAARARRLDCGLERVAHPVQVRGSEWLLREALLNLVDNAIRYSPPGGAVTVSIKTEGEQAVFSVQDEGPGMSDNDIAHAGVRFRRGKAGKHLPGAGLGLAIIKTIADIHGASLMIERALTGGLHVSLIFKQIQTD